MKATEQQPEAVRRITLFAEVILPLPLPKMFRYRVPMEWVAKVQPGMRVVVEFGKRKIMTGVVHHLHENPPEKYQAKYLLDLLEEAPSILSEQLRFWEWMASYYLCHIGEVMNAALPSGLKISSTSYIQLHPEYELYGHDSELTEQEAMLVSSIRAQGSVPFEEAPRLSGLKNAYPIIRKLIEKRVILLFEEAKEKYQPKVETKVRLAARYAGDEDALRQLFDQLSAHEKQLQVLLAYLTLMPLATLSQQNTMGVSKKALSASSGFSASSFATLAKKGVLETFNMIVPRFQTNAEDLEGVVLPDLSGPQQQAMQEISNSFGHQQVCLLQGVTGSGKTEIYIRLIAQVLESGSQALFLVPEIVLTAQLVSRLRKVFGNRLGVYHSRFSGNERVEVWKAVRESRCEVVIGVRSALFLPFSRLGLIIVDEEHESSYKQHDPAPRYMARDSAIMLAHMVHAKVLLGSATPSVESAFLAREGTYGLVRLGTRYGEGGLPNILFANMRQERQDKTAVQGFSSVLLDRLDEQLKQKKQAIVFHNRRGYAPWLNCQACDWIPKCHQCAVSLTYHLGRHEMVCHYCGYKETPPRQCPQCGSSNIRSMSMGTERLEEELQLLMPKARISRMDLETTRSKTGYMRLIEEFETAQTDIMVGTQMVAKGLDFEKVQLVGIFDADRLIHFPDFRAEERAFQLMMQVSGRAGRRDQAGQVVIQTSDPEQKVLSFLSRHDYEGFYAYEIGEREKFRYPPFTRLIQLTIKSPDEALGLEMAQRLAQELREKIGYYRVLGPQPPLIEKVRNLYLQQILIKLERKKVPIAAAKERIAQCVTEVSLQKAYRKCSVVIDVDPY